jgi:hypothetical protein
MDELDGYSGRLGHPLSYVRTALRPRQCKAPRPGGPQDHGSLSPVHFDFRRSVARADRRGDPRSGHRIRLHPVPGNQCRRKHAPGRGRGRDGHLRGVFFLGSGTGLALIGPFLVAREESRSATINPRRRSLLRLFPGDSAGPDPRPDSRLRAAGQHETRKGANAQ